jgi:hypothetical protein
MARDLDSLFASRFFLRSVGDLVTVNLVHSKYGECVVGRRDFPTFGAPVVEIERSYERARK